MDPYPPLFQHADFAAIAALAPPERPKTTSKSARVSLRSSEETLESGTLRPSRDTFGVDELWLECSGVRSQSFDDGPQHGAPMVGRFCFAPGVDAPQIRFRVTNRKNITKVRLELRCIAEKGKILWSQEWTGEHVQPLLKAGSAAFDDVVDIDPATQIGGEDNGFLDGYPTVEHSPYRLAMTVEGTGAGYPTVAFTYFDVLVHSLELTWGKKRFLAAPADVVAPHADRKHKFEKDLLEALRTAHAAPAGGDHDVELRSNLIANPNNNDDAALYALAWGKGPRIPLMARVRVRRADGSGTTRAHGALGNARFVWDWEDDGVVRHDAWVGPDAVRRRITRRFLDQTLKKDDSLDHPKGSRNCPVACGGKRGPGAEPVFPPSPGTAEVPFEVEDTLCATRRWASVSRPGRGAWAGKTGVLFQPARMAGDRYRVTVYYAHRAAGLTALDVKDTALATLRETVEAEPAPQQVPHATSGVFQVWRRLDVVYLHGPTIPFGGTTAGIDRIYGEGGIRLSYQPVPLSRKKVRAIARLRTAIDTRVGQIRDEYHRALAVHLVMPLPQPNLDSGYGLFARNRAESLAALQDELRTLPIYVLELSAPLREREVSRNGTAVRGAILKKLRDAPCTVVVLAYGAADAYAVGDTLAVVHPPDAPASANVTKATALARRVTLTRTADPNAAKGVYTLTATGGTTATLTFPSLLRTGTSLGNTMQHSVDHFVTTALGAHAGTVDIDVSGLEISPHDHTRHDNIAAHLNTVLASQGAADVGALYEHLMGAPVKISDFATEAMFRQTFRGMPGDILTAVTDAICNSAKHRDKEGLVVVHYEASSKLNILVSGGFEPGKATVFRGIGSVNSPLAPTYHRLLKPLVPLIVHECGHALFIAHSQNRLFDTKAAGGAWDDHVKWDTCVMNYDIDSELFCGLCLLRLRGWQWDTIPTDGGLSQPQAEQQMRDEIAAGPDVVWTRIRLAKILGERGAGGEAVTMAEDAWTHRAAVVAANTPDEIALIRNMIYVHRLYGAIPDAERYFRMLVARTTHNMDVDDWKSEPWAKAILNPWP
jgi:hypothetical protein